MINSENLKRSILKYAFSGKLIDSSYFKLSDCEEIIAESIRQFELSSNEGLFKKRKISRKNDLSLEDGPSNNWALVKIGLLCAIYNGDSINADEKKKNYTDLEVGRNYIGTKDVGFDSVINYENGIKIPFSNKEFKIAYKRSVLLCMEGGSAGKKITITDEDVCFGNKLCCFYPFAINERYLFFYLQSPQFLNQFTDGVSGLIGGVGSNKLKNMIIPVPPLEYQIRLAQKLSVLMYLVEDLKQKEQQLDRIDKKLIKDLKFSVLKSAFEGKFKTNNPQEESSRYLIESIKDIKNKLIAKKDYKKEKTDLFIFNDQSNVPYENWCKTNLGSLIILTSGNDLTANEYSPKNIGIPYFTGASNINDQGTLIINRFTSDKYKNSDLNDILFSCKGTIGKTAINNVGPCHIARQFMGIKTFIDSDFTRYFLASIVGQLESQSKSMIPGIDRNTLLKSEIMLPPLEEQKRIVSVIKESFEKIDELSALLKR